MPYGTVKWFSDSKGFGYIIEDGTQEELLAHFSEIRNPGPKTLRENQRVKFEKNTAVRRAVDIYSV